MKLKKALNALASNTYNITPNIDFGGCCVVAAHVAKHLSKIVPTRIVHGQGDEPVDLDLDEIRANNKPRNKDDWERNGLDFAHILVEFKYKKRWYAYDTTNGVVFKTVFWKHRTPWERCKGSFTVEEATDLANTDDWNSMFNRKHIPAIRKTIDNCFKNIEL